MIANVPENTLLVTTVVIAGCEPVCIRDTDPLNEEFLQTTLQFMADMATISDDSIVNVPTAVSKHVMFTAVLMTKLRSMAVGTIALVPGVIVSVPVLIPSNNERPPSPCAFEKVTDVICG